MSDDRRLFQGLFTGVIYSIRLGICFSFTRLTPDLHVQQTEKIRFSFLFMLFCTGSRNATHLLRDPHIINSLRTNPTKWSNTLKQFVGHLPTNCLNVFDHFVGLALKGLKQLGRNVFHRIWTENEEVRT